MVRFFVSLLGFFRSVSACEKRTTFLDHKVEDLRRLTQEAESRLAADRQGLLAAYETVTEKHNRALESVDQAAAANRKLATALDAARDEIETMRKMVIPGLVTAHETIVKRMEADIAASSMRAAMASTSGGTAE